MTQSKLWYPGHEPLAEKPDVSEILTQEQITSLLFCWASLVIGVTDSELTDTKFRWLAHQEVKRTLRDLGEEIAGGVIAATIESMRIAVLEAQKQAQQELTSPTPENLPAS